MIEVMDLVMVEWIDSHVTAGGWIALGDLHPALPTVQSVGWITSEDDAQITVSPHFIGEHPPSVPAQVCGVMVIPKVAVQRIVRMEARHDDQGG